MLDRDISTYKGAILELFFRTLFAESKQFNKIGFYWEHDNEINLVALNDQKKQIVIAEIKCNKSQIRNAEKLLQHYPGYTPHYLMLSLEDASTYLA